MILRKKKKRTVLENSVDIFPKGDQKLAYQLSSVGLLSVETKFVRVQFVNP